MELPISIPIEKVLLICTGSLFAIQLFYHLIIYIRVVWNARKALKGKITYSEERPPLSVILYHNGTAEELEENLPAILEQDYPKFEVIVITDEKVNESVDYLKRIEEQYPHLYHSYLPDSSKWISRKKLAINLGIRASKYDWLVFTESFCQPESPQWLSLMSRNFTPDTQIVLGYSHFSKEEGWTPRNRSFDNFFRSLRYLCMGLLHLPYMATGRNMAYRKELYFQTKGFGKHLDLLRGDDDLYINQVATRKNTRVETAAEASVVMKPLKAKKFWKEERLGYESTSRHFRGMQRQLLGFETFTRFLFFACAITAIVWGVLMQHLVLLTMAALCLIMRFISLAVVINQSARLLGEHYRYYTTLPLLDVIQPLQSLRWKLLYHFSDKSEYHRK